MKLKFKADATDVLIFVLFAIFLFYIVCLGVLNFPELAINGRFYGLNPLPALASDRIVTTLVFYILFLAAIFMSVSSYFFERESGFGFSTEKSSKGYSHWAKEKEIKEDKGIAMVRPGAETSDVAGIPLIIKKDEVWVDNGEYHSLVIGATGSGKTQTVIFPTVEVLAKKKESMIITDPKGEIYEQTSNMLRAKGYNVLVLNFRDPQDGNAWNPLSLPYRMYKSGNQDKAIELLDDLAANILYEEKSGNADPFWEKTSADYFAGLALALFDDATEDQINLNSISLMTTVGEEKFGGSTYMKEYFNMMDPSGAAYTNASGTIMAPSETKGSIISVFKQKIKLFATRENLSEMLSHSDFELDSIGEKPTVLYIVIQDEKKTYHSLVTILLKQCYETLIATAQKHGGKLPVRTNFLLDEFANMPPLKDITTMITAARSRQIRFTMIIQNFAQLDQVYGKENAETIKGNCGNTIYLITTELKALEEISKMCGEVKSKKDDKTASTPLVTISDLQRMKQFEVIIMRMRKNPFKTKFVPYYQMEFGKKYAKAEYPHRDKEEVHTFDLREYVKQKKKEKLMEMMNNPTGTPAGGGMPNMGGSGMGMPGGMFGGMPGSMPRNNTGMMGSNSMMPNSMMNNSGMMGPNPMNPNPYMMPNSSMNGVNNSSVPNNAGLNVDDIIKKIDAKIAEIEKEEKKQQEANVKPVVEAKTEAVEVKPEISPSKEKMNASVLSSKNPIELEKVENSSETSTIQDKSKKNLTIDDLLQSNQGKTFTESATISTNSSQKEKIESTSEAKVEEKKPIIHEDKLPANNVISDDQFFDDFFDD